MGLVDEAKVLTGRPTFLDIVKTTLSKQDYAEFIQAMQDRSISSAAISKVLSGRGIKSSEAAIRRWRRTDTFANNPIPQQQQVQPKGRNK